MTGRRGVLASDVAQRFAEARRKLGLSQAQMAENLGVFQGKISDIELEKAHLAEDVLAGVARKFSVNVNWLLTGDGEMFQESAKPAQNPVAEPVTEYPGATPGQIVVSSLRRVIALIEAGDLPGGQAGEDGGRYYIFVIREPKTR